MNVADKPRILVIRRDNIGDLVCTTPLIAALRRRFPGGYIAALVNSYNRAVLDGNPMLDAVYAYTKAKHRGEGESLIGVHANRIRVFVALRRLRFDYAVLAAPHYQPHALRFARAAGARTVVGFVDTAADRGVSRAIPYANGGQLHEVEDVFRLGTPFGIVGEPPRPQIYADPTKLGQVREALHSSKRTATTGSPVIAVHISARKPSQRWPLQNFAIAMEALHRETGARFILLWAPGGADSATHPGDDDRAKELHSTVSALPVLAWPTRELPDLVAALEVSDAVLCADGGAMHLAAALGKPIACLFGDSSPERWRPWGVPHEVLQTKSRNVVDVPIERAIAAVRHMLLVTIDS